MAKAEKDFAFFMMQEMFSGDPPGLIKQMAECTTDADFTQIMSVAYDDADEDTREIQKWVRHY